MNDQLAEVDEITVIEQTKASVSSNYGDCVFTLSIMVVDGLLTKRNHPSLKR